MPAAAQPTVLPSPIPANAPPGFHLLAKPSGSTCNIDCTYCFFLSKESLYPNDKHRMSEATLEAYIRQLLESHRTPQVTVAWQGGEPTLMKLEFFRRAVELVEQVPPARPDGAAHLPDQRPAARRRLVRVLQAARLPGRPERRRSARAARHLPRRPPRPGHLRPGDARLALSAQARCRLQHPVHRQRRQPAARPHGVPLLPRRAGREVGAVHPDHRARHRADASRSPTRAGASSRASSACSTRRPATWSPSARSAPSNTAAS